MKSPGRRLRRIAYWWGINVSDFPAFHEAAQYVILRAVSSAACERVFSVAKHVYESCGAAMSESVFNGRVRAKYNKNKVPDFGETRERVRETYGYNAIHLLAN